MASAISNATTFGWVRRPCACRSGQCIPTRAGLKSKYPNRYYYKCSRGNVRLLHSPFFHLNIFACTINYVNYVTKSTFFIL
ncbi:hypothetical protein RHMOL_Rhmol03G0133800 [Rhododendron molle]|uniref:Uncharacterized protein n=1 Tax=Rhododendron molle TaxID=49168 RepID=A0ACC0PGC0_RHOML|nr:hypothetical protein RHMOL_Rhmol03G0133800 [Rhododendron molle]